MKLTQLEQSGVIIQSDSGFRLGIDIGSYTPLEALSSVLLDAMIISHFHPDHFSLDHISALKPPKLYLSQECIDKYGSDRILDSEIVKIKSGETVAVGDISCLVFDVDHGPNATVVPKENFGFLFTMGAIKIFFAGDMYYPSGIDVSELMVDHLLVPVGGHYTFGPKEAVAYAKSFKTVKEAHPMHFEISPATKDDFIKLYHI